MFYAHFVLAKKGPLARIWLAAHWDKKLTKAHVFETNIEQSIEGIIQPKVKMALRTSGHLLLGVVRIYSRKAKYLLSDCNEAFVKIKMAFRPGMVDLPEDNREAAVNAITLPELFHDFDTAIPDLDEMDIQAQFTMNQTRAEEITMREDYGNINLETGDDGFGEQVGSPEMLREGSMMEPDFGAENYYGVNDMELSRNGSIVGDQASVLLGKSNSMILSQSLTGSRVPSLAGSVLGGRPPSPGSMVGSFRAHSPALSIGDSYVGVPPPSSPIHSVKSISLQSHPGGGVVNLDDPIQDDGFGGSLATTGQDILAGGLFEDGSLFDDGPVGGSASERIPPSESGGGVDDYYGDGGDSPPRPSSPLDGSYIAGSYPDQLPVPGSPTNSLKSTLSTAKSTQEANTRSTRSQAVDKVGQNEVVPEVEITTLIRNEEESFALAPVVATAVKGHVRAKRKRKLIVDGIKAITGEEMKGQLSDTGDILTTLDLAPPTKRLMHWKETGGVEKLFALPGRLMTVQMIYKDYQNNLTCRSVGVENFDTLIGDREKEPDLPLELVRDAGNRFETPEVPEKREPRRKKRKVSELSNEGGGEYARRQEELATAMEESGRMERERIERLEQEKQEEVRSRLETTPEVGVIQSPKLDTTPVRPEETSKDKHVLLLDQEMSSPKESHIRNDQEMESPPKENHVLDDQEMLSPPINYTQPAGFGEVPTIGAETPGFVGATPGYVGATPGYAGATPGYVGATPGYVGATPGYDMASPDYGGVTPVYGGVTPAHDPAYTCLIPDDNPQQENQPNINDPQIHQEEQNQIPPLLPPTLPLHQGPDFTDQWVSEAVGTVASGAAITPTHHMEWEEAAPQVNGRISPEEEEEYEEESDDNEYQDEETVEEFEDRVLNKRAAQLHYKLKQKWEDDKEQILFSSVAKRRKDTYKQAAQKFYSLLVLQKIQTVDLDQRDIYGELIITKGPKFNSEPTAKTQL